MLTRQDRNTLISESRISQLFRYLSDVSLSTQNAAARPRYRICRYCSGSDVLYEKNLPVSLYRIKASVSPNIIPRKRHFVKTQYLSILYKKRHPVLCTITKNRGFPTGCGKPRRGSAYFFAIASANFAMSPAPMMTSRSPSRAVLQRCANRASRSGA